MNKKSTVLAGLMMLAASAAFVSCGNDAQSAKQSQEEQNVASAKESNGVGIAFVQIDTVMNQYQKYKDLDAEFTKKMENAQATIEAKNKSFLQQYQAFENKARSNGFTTQQQFEQEQARLAKLKQDADELAARLDNQLGEDRMNALQALNDSIMAFAEDYAKEKGFDFILCKSKDISNVLYANEKYDVTKEVVNALNKRYKGTADASAKDAKKEEKAADDKQADDKK